MSHHALKARRPAASAALGTARAGRQKARRPEGQGAARSGGQKSGTPEDQKISVEEPASPELSEPRALRPPGPQAVRSSGSPVPGPVDSPALTLVRSVGRAPDTVAFERQIVDFFIEASDILGAPKSVAAIYGIIFASPEPLGFLELQERLDISAGSISQGLKALKTIGAIKPATAEDWQERPGTRDQGLGTGDDGPGTRDEGPGTRDQGPETLPPTTGGPKRQRSLVPGPSSLVSNRPSLVPGPSLAPPKRPGEGGSLVSAARRDFYVPNLEARKLVAAWIDQRLQKQLDAGETRLAAISASAPAAQHPSLRERVDQLNNWHEKASALLPLVKTFLNVSGMAHTVTELAARTMKKATP